MNLKPSRWLSGPMKGWVAGAERGSLWLELEVISPASSVGRKAHLYLSEEDVTEVLKVLKERARHTRSQPLGEGDVMDAVSWEEGDLDPIRAVLVAGGLLDVGGASDDYA